MARGANAKQEVENIIRNAFGKNFLGVADKKLYVRANDGDEMVDISITLTCPKTPFGVVDGGMNFDAAGVPAEPDVFQPAEMTNEETERVRKLIEKFNL